MYLAVCRACYKSPEKVSPRCSPMTKKDIAHQLVNKAECAVAGRRLFGTAITNTMDLSWWLDNFYHHRMFIPISFPQRKYCSTQSHIHTLLLWSFDCIRNDFDKTDNRFVLSISTTFCEDVFLKSSWLLEKVILYLSKMLICNVYFFNVW